MVFDSQPVLRGDLVALRPLRADDYEALSAVAADPLIWEQHPIKDRHDPDVFRSLFQESLDSGGALIATDLETGRVIGSSRFQVHEARGEVEIGWTFLARSHWGGRYNGEMKRLMLGHAFQFVDRVVFLVGVDNLRSQRAMERIGAGRIGTRQDAGGHDSHVYEVTASAFASPQGRGTGGGV